MIDKPAVVIDNGSVSTRVGFSGHQTPKFVFDSKIGVPRDHLVDGSIPGLSDLPPLKERYGGNEAEAKRGIVCLRYPVRKGVITNWDDMEKLWQHSFEKLETFSKEHPVLLTDAVNNPKANRERTAQIMMETFQTPALFIAIQGVLSLYATGRLNGIVCDIGGELSQFVPVSNGYAISDAAAHLELGGRALSDYLMKILMINGVPMTYQTAHLDVGKMKEEHCCVARDYDREMKTALDKQDFKRSYTLRDDTIVTISSERYQCPEALFQPSFLDEQFSGIHKACFDSIIKCNDAIRKDLFANIVLCGGSSMFPGIVERMKKEITALAPANTIVNVIASPQREHSVWIGGSILANQEAFKDMWISKQEYDEVGPAVVHKKCP